MFSTRYAIPVALLLTVTLVPSLIHNYFGLTVTDGKTTNRISNRLSDFESKPSSRNPEWGEVTFDCYDWFERIYKDKQGNSVRLFVGRSFDHKKLYHHPELALSYGNDLARAEKIDFSLPPEITVYLLRANGKRGMAAYALLYEDEFIANPILHQINNSLNLLVSPRKPLTLFYVSDDNEKSQALFAETTMAHILRQAIDDFTSSSNI
ncbi:hypothetical protein [Methylomarinum vadi]|uniref:hypothetical protein n=1 Tax=Methylomarinum vadi TaxID=438855 RepID=UPI0004DED7AC|nr:hypothetical protein [Methylomarinum vadi]